MPFSFVDLIKSIKVVERSNKSGNCMMNIDYKLKINKTIKLYIFQYNY